jgi:hypothetical protein
MVVRQVHQNRLRLFSGIEKKLQQEIVLGFQGFPKLGVDTQTVHLFYDGFLFDENARVREQLKVHAQNIPSPEGALRGAEQIEAQAGKRQVLDRDFTVVDRPVFRREKIPSLNVGRLSPAASPVQNYSLKVTAFAPDFNPGLFIVLEKTLNINRF